MMKNKIVLIVLLACGLLTNGHSIAQTPTLSLDKEEATQSSSTIKTGEVKVTDPIVEDTDTTESLTKKDFNLFKNERVTDAINQSTSINTVLGSRGENTFRMRGFTQQQVPVLLDGIPIYIPFDGIMGLDRIPTYNIDEIKIIKGAPSAIYGPNTLGGAINIITAKPKKPFEARVRFSDNYVNTFNNDLYIGSKLKNVYFALNQSFSKGHGFSMSRSFDPTLNENGGIRDNSSFQNLSLGGMLGYSSNEFQDYRLSYSYLNSPWEVPPEIDINRPRYWRFSKWRKNTLAFSIKQGISQNRLLLNGNFYYDKYFNILDSYDNNSYTSQLMRYAFHSTYDDHTLGFNFIPEVKLCKYVKIKPIFLYKRDVHKEMPDRNTPEDIYKASTTSVGGEIVFTPIERVTVEASLSVDRNKPIYNNGNYLRGPIWAFSSQGDISFHINDKNKLYFNIGRKTRFPTLKELYSGYIGRNIPNPELEQESALTYEAGYSNRFRDLMQIDLSFYRSHLNNLIVDVPIRKNVFQLQNISKATFSGFDADFSASMIKDRLEFNSGYSYLYAADNSPGRVNNYIPYVPKHKFYAGLTTHLPLEILARLQFMYVSTVLYQDNQDLQWKKLGGYPIINLSLMKTFKEKYSFFVSIQNMLDKNYETEARFPMPGISVALGLKLEI